MYHISSDEYFWIPYWCTPGIPYMLLYYGYKYLAVENFFLALDICRKCPLPRVSRDHFSKVYRWIDVAKTYKFWIFIIVYSFRKSLNWWVSSVNWWISSVKWWISSVNSWPINETRTPNFFVPEVVIKLGVQTFFAQTIFSHWLALHNHSENLLLMIYSVSECML